MSIVAIVNPISGASAHPERVQQRVARLRTEGERRGHPIEIRLTEGPGHARELARRAVEAGASMVVVWGGDGTINESCSALVGSGTPLALIPAGSGNGLAAALRIPHDATAALSCAFDGAAVPIDVGLIGDRHFLNIAGVGFDARIARLFNQQPLGRRGAVPYAVIGVREGCRYQGQDYALEFDGRPQRVRALLVAFANGCEYGNGACIAPSARVDDGLLEAVVIEERSVARRFWHARHLATRTAHRAPGVTLTQVRRAVIQGSGPLEVHVDGESYIAEGPLEVAVLPRALRVKAGPDFVRSRTSATGDVGSAM